MSDILTRPMATPAVAPESGASPLAGRLDALAFGLLAILPLAMAIANKSAPAVLVAAALAAIGARAAAGELPASLARVLGSLQTPIGAVALAFLAFGAVSILWSGNPKTSLHALGELTLCAGAALVLHAALPRNIPPWAIKAGIIAIALACLLVVVELSTGMMLRKGLGIRDAEFIFKRPVTAMLIVVWPLLVALWLQRRTPIGVALVLLLGIATYFAHSSTTALALVAGCTVAALALRSVRGAAAITGVLMLAAMAIAPVLGDTIVRLLPPQAIQRLAFAHAEERIEIWQGFGEVVRRRPFGGAGFGTSSVMAKQSVATEVPEEHRAALGGWHSHNGFLQVWAETGVIGATIFGIGLLLLARALWSARGAQAIAGAALLGSAIAVMLVGHSIWQGWWIAVLGVSAVWIARLPASREAAASSLAAPRRPRLAPRARP